MSTAPVTFKLSDAKPAPITFKLSDAKPVSPKPAPSESLGQKVQSYAAELAPAAGMMAGGIAGALTPVPGGAAIGAGLGGAAGEALSEHLKGEKVSPAKVAESGAIGAGSELGAGLVAKGVGKVAEAAAPKLSAQAEKIIARVVGPIGAKMPAGGKLEGTRAIAAEVNKVAGNAKSLAGLQTRVTAAKEAALATADQAVKSAPASTKISVYDTLISKGSQEIGEARARGLDYKAIQIDRLVDKLRTMAGADELSPADAAKLRSTLHQEYDPATKEPLWPAGTKGFRTEVRKDLNRKIAASLPPDQAKQYLSSNLRAARLIDAENALDRKMASKLSTKQLLLRHGSRLGVGGVLGYEAGGYRGAVAGAAAGELLGSTAGELTQAQSLRGLSKAAATIGKASGAASKTLLP